MEALSGPAREFGRALAELALEQDELAAITRDLEGAREALAPPEVKAFFANPLVQRQAKLELVEKLFAGRATETFLRFLKVVVIRRRERLIREIIQQALYECLARQGREVVFVTTSQPLDAEQTDLVNRGLASALGAGIYPEYRVNPNLLGGIIVRRGDQLLDASISGILRRLGELLANGVTAGQR